MKRNVIFFLDLVLQCLALMIVVTSVAAQQRGGVGLVKPSAKYVSVEVLYEEATLAGSSEPLVVSADDVAASLFTVRIGTKTWLVISGRHYERKGAAENRQPMPTVIYVDKILLATVATIRIATADHPNPETIRGKLRDLNERLKYYIRFEERPVG
jgi:hypothetical protein